MALFDFLKGLTASDRRELEAKYAQMVTVNQLKDEVKALQKAIAAIKQPDLSGYVKTKDLPDISKYALAKDIPKIPDSAEYWKNQNTKHPVNKATLFIGDKPTKAPDSQITIVT